MKKYILKVINVFKMCLVLFYYTKKIEPQKNYFNTIYAVLCKIVLIQQGSDSISKVIGTNQTLKF
jgi:hypothetical protein